MERKPVVAGRFYDADPAILSEQVNEFLGAGADAVHEKRTLLAMTPHAGYVFSGGVAGLTLGRANLASTVLLLGPNHTGNGLPLAVWREGVWKLPLGAVPVAEDLADALLEQEPRLKPDVNAHLQEHSLEVITPFLLVKNPQTRVVPIAVAEPSLKTLLSVGQRVGEALAGWKEPVSIVVSSDMSHYVSHERASELDHAALTPVLQLDPAGLYETVRSKGVSMCGVLPMTLGLAAAKAMGAEHAELTQYATSGEVSGDYNQVVGYAGVLVE